MHPKFRPYLGSTVMCLSLLPAGIEFYRSQSAIAEDKSAQQQISRQLEQSKQQTSQEIQTALYRAETCLTIDESFPLVEGGRAFYDATGRKSNRLLPKGTYLCSSASGFTAEVNGRGLVSDVIPAPVEKLREVLKNRGIVK